MRLKRCLCLFLSLLLLAMPVCGENENTLLWTRETDLSPDVTMTETVFDNGYRQVEHYISYTPGTAVQPAVVFGDSLTETLTLQQAEALEEQNGSRMLAGINGDYYVMASGMPLGLVVRSGELITSDGGNYAFGFLADGTAFLGRPALTMSLTLKTGNYPLNSINKALTKGNIGLYTGDYGSKISHGTETVNVLLCPAEGETLRIGGETHYTVESVFTAKNAFALPEGRLVLSVTADSDAWRLGAVHALQIGDSISLRIAAEDPRWEQCVSGIGSLYRLITDGSVEDNLNSIDRTMAPRTAIGLKADGTVLIYTVDGRQSGYSRGLTLAETAQRLLELGCVNAGALDGGASTVLYARNPGQADSSLKTSPSLGTERKVPVFLMLTGQQGGSGMVKTVSLDTETKALLCSADTELTVGACDETGAPVNTVFQWSADSGTIEKGHYTAPAFACTAVITAAAQGVIGTLTLPVVETPDSISLLREDNGSQPETLVMLPGSSTELTAKAFWHSVEVTAQDTAFQWSVTGDAGSVTEDGCFTASQGGTGTLTVSAGKCTVSIPVLVMDTVLCAESFEAAEPGSAPGLSWSLCADRDRVCYGSGSLCLSYDLRSGSADYSMEQYETGLTRYASIWVRCDGSGNGVYAVQDKAILLLGDMDHVGWEQYVIDTGTYGKLHALRFTGSGSGTVWLDQLLLSNTEDTDLEAPVILLESTDTGIRAQVWDRNQKSLPETNLRLTVDGTELTFTYDALSGELWADWTKGEGMAHILLYAMDNSGNYASAALMLGSESVTAFPDMKGHWASDYAVYLSRLGVINGKPGADGETVFDPDTPVTRGEFAVMLCRWLKIDTDLYAGTGTFTDQSALPSWAADSISAVQALGLMTGTETAGGFAFEASRPLSRLEAAVILAHTMEAGRMHADLPFADAQKIAETAIPYVSELAQMGVMQGYDNIYDPDGSLTRAQAAKILSVMT